MMRIEKGGYHGILLPDYDIGLDVGSDLARHIFISHAHADHVPGNRHLAVYATPPTAALMRVRGFRGHITELPFGRKIELGQASVTFFPAGHILGSAMTYVETDAGSLLYTGDYRNPPSPCSEGFMCPQDVDYLITEATFSLPIYKWKTHEELFNDVRTFALYSKSKGNIPVFITYTLGKAQEVMMALAPLDTPIQVHSGAYGLCKVYEEYGFHVGSYSKIGSEIMDDSILVIPMSFLDSGVMQKVKNKRIAYCSGWADLEARRAQQAIDALIPLSDHIDFFELIELCKQLRPKHVYITHTPNPDVVQHYLSLEGISSSPFGLEQPEEF
jgi:putative mRNA 3-end processing factor